MPTAMTGASDERALEAKTALEREVVLPGDVAPAQSQLSASPRTMFVTGATGFLGTRLVAELLDATDATVHALVRASDDREAAMRLREALERGRLWPGESERLQAHAGSLTTPRLGLDRDAYELLAAEASHVFHAGAVVNASHPYAALKPANVEGMVEVLRLVAHGSAKRMHHFSSLAAIAPRGDDRAPLSERDSLDDPAGLADAYAQTKWVAERLAAVAAERGLDVVVYRIGALAGDTRTGLQNQRDYRWLIVRASLALEAAPLLRSTVAWLPVDDAARAIRALSSLPTDLRRFHLVGANRLPWLELFSWLRRRGHRLRLVDVELWRRRLEELEDGSLTGLLAAEIGSGGATRPSVTDSETLAALAALGISPTPLDAELLGRFVDVAAAR